MTANAPQKPREIDREVAHDRASIALPPRSGYNFATISSAVLTFHTFNP